MANEVKRSNAMSHRQRTIKVVKAVKGVKGLAIAYFAGRERQGQAPWAVEHLSGEEDIASFHHHEERAEERRGDDGEFDRGGAGFVAPDSPGDQPPQAPQPATLRCVGHPWLRFETFPGENTQQVVDAQL